MSQMSNYLENELIDHIVRNSSWSSPATIYLALYTSDPTDADSGTEVSGGAYARQSVAFDAPSNGVTQNTSDITFPQATADWGTITHVGLRDALTGGNLLFHGALSPNTQINNGGQLQIDAGDLEVTLA